MNDRKIIYLDDAIDALDNIKIARNASWYPYYQQALTAVSKLPSAQPEDKCGECDAWNQYKNYPRQQWIPCSERLPEDDTDFLVTDGESMAVGYYRQDVRAWDSADFGWIENRKNGYGINKVIAWMPLPEPYKEGDKNDR